MLTTFIGVSPLGCNMGKNKNPQKRHWLGTVWPGHLEFSTDTFHDWWCTLQAAPGLAYAIAQVEESDEGKLHIQVYTEWKQSVRRSEVAKRAGNAHWEPRRGTRTEARDYCRKKDSRVEKLGEFGTWRPDVASDPTESPKNRALKMLMEGLTPQQICAVDPNVFFTHHRSIIETWKMLQLVQQTNVLICEEE